MAFTVTTRTGRGVIARLRHLGIQAMNAQQRTERYVAHMPTAVLGAC